MVWATESSLLRRELIGFRESLAGWSRELVKRELIDWRRALIGWSQNLSAVFAITVEGGLRK